MHRYFSCILITLLLLASGEGVLAAERSPGDVLSQAFAKHCVECHGAKEKVKGKVNLLTQGEAAKLRGQPDLMQTLIDVLENHEMPPEDEGSLDAPMREAMVKSLRGLLGESLQEAKVLPTPIRRMNRFQYNNAVQDLFELRVEVFPLPERMMREYGNYFQPQTGKMPDVVTVGSRPLGKSQLIEDRLGDVSAFPQDLRAEHGYDNQADHLSLSPFLLESFLTLSQSILQSKDFHAKSCGIWPWYFAAPPMDSQATTDDEVRKRLQRFLTRAFRRPVDGQTLDRYTQLVLSQLESGADFPQAMKAAATSAIASPRFFYLYDGQVDSDLRESDDFNLASRLSFFLWGSIPDEQLLRAAATGKLHEPQVLAAEVDRMLADRKLKRFCDSFPSQWLQLDRIVSSSPDAKKFPQFFLFNEKYRVSMHMMLEPLLLFETVLIENQSVLQFIDSDFSYRSKMLESWYRDGSSKPQEGPVTIKFRRVPITDRRQGGLITNAAVMTMTSGAAQTKPITRGAWVLGVILNDPPSPPPADVPPLPEHDDEATKDLTIRQRFAMHRTRTDCAACHRNLDPLGFALENYNEVGIWRNQYATGQQVDASGVLFGNQPFADVVEFKDRLLGEKDRFARAFAKHLLAFALGRPVGAADSPVLDRIVAASATDEYRLQTMMRQIIFSEAFVQEPQPLASE